MRPLLAFALLLLPFAALADETLRCDIARGGATETLSAPMVEGSGEVQAAGIDASLGPSTWLVVLEDSARARRVAFSGSSRGVSHDGATLALGASSSVRCARVPDGKPSFAPPISPELPDYLVCMVDEAHFVGGEPAESKRRLFRTRTPLSPRMGVDVSGEDAAVSFSVSLLPFDPFHGLSVKLTDKATGETASYSGPARSMLASFLLGLTLGDRAVDARFLRLGCVWTSDPSAFK